MTEVEVAETKSKTADDFAFATRRKRLPQKFPFDALPTNWQTILLVGSFMEKDVWKSSFGTGICRSFGVNPEILKLPSKTRAIFTFATHLFVCQVVGTTTARIIKERISSEPQEQLHHVQIFPGKQMTARKTHKWQYWLVHRGSL